MIARAVFKVPRTTNMLRLRQRGQLITVRGAELSLASHKISSWLGRNHKSIVALNYVQTMHAQDS